MILHKYVIYNGSTATLATMRLAGVALIVNLRLLMHAGDKKLQARRSTLALKPRADVIRNMGTSGRKKRKCFQ